MRSICLALLFAVYCLHTVFAQTNGTLIAAAADLYKKGAYEEALPIFEKCLATAKQANDSSSQVILYDHIGHVYSQTGRPAEALRFYQQSAVISEITGNKAASARSLINIGALYEEQKDFTKALENYSVAENIGLLIHDSSIIADCANNKGVIYEQYLKKYPEAIKEYNKALNIYSKLQDQPHLAMTYNNLGIVYKYQGNYSKAIEYYKRSLAIGESTGNQFLIAANMTNIGNVFAMQKEYQKAIEYNTGGLDIALKIKAMNVVVEAAGSIAEDYAGMKNYEKAYEWHQRFSAYSDSLFNSERLQQIGELEGKYQTAKKEKEITQLKDRQLTDELNLSKQKILLQKRNYQFAGVGGTVLLIGVIAFLLYSRQQLKQKQQKENAILEAENKERKRISWEMHDYIGAGLTQITLMSEHARMQVQPTYINDLAAIATTSRKLVNNMSEIVWSLNPENKTIDLLFAYLREQLNNLLEYSGIDFTIDFPEVTVPVMLSNEQKRNILMATKEMVHNAVKYSKAKKISVAATLNNGLLKFEVADNGIGFDTSASFSGNGMKNIRQRILELGGELLVQSTENKGTAFSFSFRV
jgi:signal transduction histidine kinase